MSLQPKGDYLDKLETSATGRSMRQLATDKPKIPLKINILSESSLKQNHCSYLICCCCYCYFCFCLDLPMCFLKINNTKVGLKICF